MEKKTVSKYEIEIPQQVVRALGFADQEVGTKMRVELAVHFFQGNLLSFGQARQLSGLSVWDFMEILRERKVPMHYSESDYIDDSNMVTELL